MKKYIVLLVFMPYITGFSQTKATAYHVTGRTSKEAVFSMDKTLLLQKKWIFPVLGVTVDGLPLKIENSKLPHNRKTSQSEFQMSFPETMALNLMKDNKFTSTSNFKAFFDSEDSAYLKTMSGTWKLLNQKTLVLTYPKLKVSYSVETISETELALGGVVVDVSKKYNIDNYPHDLEVIAQLMYAMTTINKLPKIKAERTIQYLLFGKNQ